jgi:hypothetical protein
MWLYYGGGSVDSGHEQEEPEVDRFVIDERSARRGARDSNKADRGGGEADNRVVSSNVDSEPANNDRGA